MNKAELVAAIAKESGLTKAAAKKALDAMIKVVSETLAKGDKVALVGFGTWKVTERKERKGRNPRTKEEIIIPAKKVVKFTPGSELAKMVEK